MANRGSGMKRKVIFATVVLTVVLGAASSFAGGVRYPRTTIGSGALTARVMTGEIVAHRKGFTDLTIVRGMSARVVQADPIWDHAIVSVAKDAKGRPLFRSAEGLRVGETGIIAGVERLEPGTYRFRDAVYTWWHGTLTVVGDDPQTP